MQTPPQRNDACTLVIMAKGTQTGHRQDAPSAETSSGSGHRTLSLSSGRHDIAGAVFGYSRGCDYVSCCGCGGTDAGGARHGARGGAERRGACGRSDLGVCALHTRWPTTRGCLQQRQSAFAGVRFLRALLKRSPITTWLWDRQMMAVIILSGRRPPMRRYSMATAWALRVRWRRCWRALANCSFPLASRIPFTTLTWRAT